MYPNAGMPRDAATEDSNGRVEESHINVDARLSSIKYSSSGLGASSGKGTATPPARHIPHCVATHANPGVTANATRFSRRSSLPASRAEATLDDVRRLADQGAWHSAALQCEQLLRTDNLNSTVHFYHALVLGQLGRQDEAERSLRRAIYLDRQSVLAHYYLGLSLQSRGNARQAERSFENVVDLLQSRRDIDILADADGITAAELRRLAKMHIEILLERV